MSIKQIVGISFIIGLVIPIIATAQIRISEFMYDPAGSDTKREWIEVFNEGSGDIDLTTWFLHENNVFHKITSQASKIVPAGSYAVIVDSIAEVLADYPDFTGLMFDSAFSLGNAGETISMANPQKVIVNTFAYTSEMGAGNDGNSLQVNGDAAITAGPTFGEQNKTESEVPDDAQTATTTGSVTSPSSGDSTHEQQEGVSKYVPSSLFKIGAGRDRTVSINAPVEFEAYVSKADIKPRIDWNFGDFSTDSGRRVTHAYGQAGVYQVVLEGRAGSYTGISRTEVTVVEPQLEFKRATSSVSIRNMAKQEINLGGFRFDLGNKKEAIPRNTILAGGATIRLNIASTTVVQAFLYPNGEIQREFGTMEW